MNIKDKSVLEMLNKLIVINRLNKSQILQMVNLVSISNNIKDLKDPSSIADHIASHLNMTISEKQQIFETFNVKKKMHKIRKKSLRVR